MCIESFFVLSFLTLQDFVGCNRHERERDLWWCNFQVSSSWQGITSVDPSKSEALKCTVFTSCAHQDPTFINSWELFLRNYSNMNLQTVWIYVFWWIWFGEQVKCSGMQWTCSNSFIAGVNLFPLKVAKVLDPEAEKKSGHLRWHHWHH